MRHPRVTVIVPTWNRCAFLGECLESLLSQRLAPWQLLVVDDCSADATADVLARFAGRIEVLRTPTQGGKGAAANLGIAHATGDYVWLFDDDDVALPGALERFTEPLERDAQAGFSFSQWAYAYSLPGGRIGPPTWVTTVPDLPRDGALPALLRQNYLGGAALFVRTSVYRELGGYDPALVRSQDFEMAIRVVRRYVGYRVSGGPTFLYRQHDGRRGSSRDRFAARLQFNKWLEYDQRIIRALRPTLMPGELLPPGMDPGAHRRLEHLEYFALMAGRLLPADALQELELLVRMGGNAPLTPLEREAIQRTTMRDPWYGVGSVLDDRSFTGGVAALAARAPLVRSVRREMIAGLRRYITMNGLGAATRRLGTAARRGRALFQPPTAGTDGSVGPVPSSPRASEPRSTPVEAG